jgi:TPR repeat protein
VDDEIYNESQADAANHGISATHKLLLLVAALTLMAALAWLFVPSSGSKGAPRQDQHPPPPASQPVVSHTAPEDFSVLRQLAEKGDPVAQFAVGAHFATGEDVPQDYAEAMRWFTMAAEQGHVGAQATLGAYYWSGRGAPQDLSKAYFWAFLAQSAGDDASRYRVTFLTSRMTHAQVVAAQQRADEWLKSHQTASTAVSQQTAQRD